MTTPDTMTMNWPRLPDGQRVTSQDVQNIWRWLVAPTQSDDAGPQSTQMRVLMGILRAYWKGYLDCEGEEQLSIFPPEVAPIGYLVDSEDEVRGVWDAFVAPTALSPGRPRMELALATLLQDLGTTLRARR